MREILENGCELIRGHGVSIGLVQTEDAGKPEAWLYWMEGQGISTMREWRLCSRESAVAELNAWLGTVGLALDNGKIVEF